MLLSHLFEINIAPPKVVGMVIGKALAMIANPILEDKNASVHNITFYANTKWPYLEFYDNAKVKPRSFSKAGLNEIASKFSLERNAFEMKVYHHEDDARRWEVLIGLNSKMEPLDFDVGAMVAALKADIAVDTQTVYWPKPK